MNRKNKFYCSGDIIQKASIEFEVFQPKNGSIFFPKFKRSLTELSMIRLKVDARINNLDEAANERQDCATELQPCVHPALVLQTQGGTPAVGGQA